MDTDKEGLTKDLVEKLKTGSLTPKQAKRELKEREIGHHGIGEALGGVLLAVCLVLMLFSTFAKVSKIETLAWIANLPTVDFPIVVRCLAAIALIGGLTMMVWASRLLSRKGGLGEGDESVIFIREGPYKVVRHPIAIGMLGLFILTPFIFSGPLSYTFLTVIGQAALVLGIPLEGRRTEEKTNIRKWGDEYRRYMQEVPKFNIIWGLWKLVTRH